MRVIWGGELSSWRGYRGLGRPGKTGFWQASQVGERKFEGATGPASAKQTDGDLKGEKMSILSGMRGKRGEEYGTD